MILPRHEIGGDGAGEEFRIVEDFQEERDSRRQPFHHHFAQRALHARNGFRAIVAPADDFGQQRIVIRGHFIPGIQVTVDADEWAAGGEILFHQPGAGHHVAVGIFRIHPAFDGMAIAV